jgi:DNA-binding response OmpR family regulator
MLSQKHILIADRDGGARRMVADMLESDGRLAISEAATAKEVTALIMTRETRVDALVLDAALPDEDGRDFCARLRRGGIRIPIILLAGLDREEDVVRGLDSGANDYVVKPFRPGELKARLRAQLRAHEASEDAVLPIGPYAFLPGTRVLQQPGNKRHIRLTEKEAAVLKYLYRAGSAPVPRSVLLREVWGYSAAATTHTVETHIYRLRRKIEPDEGMITLLLNEDGGYRLNLDWRPEAAWTWAGSVPAPMAAFA